jgi:hypothetical protein
MAPPNATWQTIIAQAQQNVEILKQTEVIRNVQNIMQTNVAVCSALGHSFISHLNIIYLDMLSIYKCVQGEGGWGLKQGRVMRIILCEQAPTILYRA